MTDLSDLLDEANERTPDECSVYATVEDSKEGRYFHYKVEGEIKETPPGEDWEDALNKLESMEYE